jgi:hypothetical protein
MISHNMAATRISEVEVTIQDPGMKSYEAISKNEQLYVTLSLKCKVVTQQQPKLFL